MSELARQILRLQRLGDNAEPREVEEVDAVLKPVRGWILWLQREFGPDPWDRGPCYTEGWEKIAPVVKSMLLEDWQAGYGDPDECPAKEKGDAVDSMEDEDE